MFQWLPSTVAPMRAEIVEIYWVLITIIVLATIILNFFEVAEGNFNPAQIIKRVVISMILLWTFEETINLISGVTEILIDQIGGMSKWASIFSEMEKKMASNSPALFKLRQTLIFIINIICFIAALAAYYIINVLMNFTYTILYVLSPLMILAYIPASTSYITASLYKGVFNVCSWKIMWSILGALLFNMTTVPEIQQADALLMQALVNLCIAIAMLIVPAFTSSLLSDGGTGFAAQMSSKATPPVLKKGADIAKRAAKAGFKTTMGIPQQAMSFFKEKDFSKMGFNQSKSKSARPQGQANNWKKREGMTDYLSKDLIRKHPLDYLQKSYALNGENDDNWKKREVMADYLSKDLIRKYPVDYLQKSYALNGDDNNNQNKGEK